MTQSFQARRWLKDSTFTALLFEEFCAFIRTPQRTVRDWKRRGLGPRWWRFNGTGRLYTTVAEVRRFLRPTTTHPVEVQHRG